MTALVRRTPAFLLQATLLSANTPLCQAWRVETVKYPHVRSRVMDSLAVLADVEYQEQCWVRGETPPGRYENFDEEIHTLFDDTNVVSDPEDNLGSSLLPGPELDRLRQLGTVLDRLLAELGDVPGADYMRHPEWPEVVRLSGLALAAMVRSWGFVIVQQDDE
jgi:hypothetical protein